MNKKTQLKMTVREVIYAEMKWPALHPLDDNESLANQGVDSLKAITILYQLEDRLDVVISNDLLESCQTVNDIVSNITIIQGETSNEN